MTRPGWRIWYLPALISLPGVGAGAATAPTDTVISSMDLSKPFHTRSPWRFTATQGVGQDSPIGLDEKVPGAVALCLGKDGPGQCDPSLRSDLYARADGGLYDDPHYLNKAEIVYPHGVDGPPLLLVQTASIEGVNGNQAILTQALAYDRATDRFRRTYDFRTRHNNNEEVRFMTAGPLQGAFISVEPTGNAPYGYWVTVSRPGKDLNYRQVLHYRSATHYNDGNSLAVIDSEMPNIERQLGLWKPGQKLPVPQAGCERPRLVHTELWCS